MLAWLDERGIPMYECHTSGHAPLRDLQRLRRAFAAAVVCPVHTADPMAYTRVFENVRVLADGEWLDVIEGRARPSEAYARQGAKGN